MLSEIVKKLFFNADIRKSNADKRRFIVGDICDHLRYICENLRLRTFFSALVICASPFLIMASGLQAEVAGRIVAIVNKVVITERDVQEALRPVAIHYSKMFKEQELRDRLREAWDDMVERMVEDELIKEEARAAKLEVDESRVDASVEEIRRQFKNEDEFLRNLKKQNLTLNRLRDWHRAQLLIQKFLDISIRKKLEVLPTEIMDYYTSHREEFTRPERLRLRHILIKVKSEDKRPKARERMKGILKEIEAGGDFAELARRYSDMPDAASGGDMGELSPDGLRKELKDAASGLAVGQVSGVITTDAGYHIIKLEERRPPELMPLDEVKAKIEGTILREKMQVEYDKLIKSLKKKAYIVIHR